MGQQNDGDPNLTARLAQLTPRQLVDRCSQVLEHYHATAVPRARPDVARWWGHDQGRRQMQAACPRCGHAPLDHSQATGECWHVGTSGRPCPCPAKTGD